MDILSVFPSKYLKGDNIATPIQYTIQSVSMEALQDGTSKPAISFAETQQLLILNKTNSMMLANLLGSETTSWVGHKVELYTEPTAFQGKIVNAIRVRKPAEPVPAAAVAPAPVTPAPTHPVAAPAADVDADVNW